MSGSLTRVMRRPLACVLSTTCMPLSLLMALGGGGQANVQTNDDPDPAPDLEAQVAPVIALAPPADNPPDRRHSLVYSYLAALIEYAARFRQAREPEAGVEPEGLEDPEVVEEPEDEAAEGRPSACRKLNPKAILLALVGLAILLGGYPDLTPAPHPEPIHPGAGTDLALTAMGLNLDGPSLRAPGARLGDPALARITSSPVPARNVSGTGPLAINGLPANRTLVDRTWQALQDHMIRP